MGSRGTLPNELTWGKRSILPDPLVPRAAPRRSPFVFGLWWGGSHGYVRSFAALGGDFDATFYCFPPQWYTHVIFCWLTPYGAAQHQFFLPPCPWSPDSPSIVRYGIVEQSRFRLKGLPARLKFLLWRVLCGCWLRGRILRVP